MKEAVVQDSDIIDKMSWSEEGIEQYAAYLKATQLLLDCLALAMVADRGRIEERLLLPPPVEGDEAR